MDNNVIVHVSEVDISKDLGMGRVEYHWRKAFENAGISFLHIGPKEIGELKHKSMFAYKAYKYYKKLKITPKAFIVHEPVSGFFIKKNIPCFLESHGVERRCKELKISNPTTASSRFFTTLKAKLFISWRLYVCDKGLKNANKLLLINTEDKDYVKKKYLRNDDDILIFKNGINSSISATSNKKDLQFTVLFNASWIERKGIYVLINAAEELINRGIEINYLLIGTGKDVNTVLNDWPQLLKPRVKVISKFKEDDELVYLTTSSLFVLPSYFEGQPLSLLQAMAVGKCCITTDCCGQKDIIENGKTGFLFKPGDSSDLARIIEFCYKKKDIIEEIGKKAQERVKHLTWENVSRELVEYVLNFPN
jgi:glycosyltransferase involved in cell wall biosynthesis